MTDFTDRANRLRTMWNRSRNLYSAFYAELDAARREIGDDKFADWCFNDLRISLSILNDTARVLRSADAGVVKAGLAQARQEEARVKQAAREERRQLAEERKRQKAERREAAKRAVRNADQKKRRDEKKAMLRLSLPAGSDELARLLAECASVEKMTRVELGRRYAAMKRIVENQQAGKNEDGKHWTWGQWSSAFIKRSRMDIYRCIQEFVTLGYNTENENVVTFPQNVA
jgi:hypothetical protein